MSRFFLLLLFVLWMAWSPDPANPPLLPPWAGTILFFAVFAGLVLVMGLWSRMLARRISDGNLHRNLRRFNRVMFLARLMVPAWFGAGLAALGWCNVVAYVLGPADVRVLEVPALLLGTMPAMLTWAGLWWSQYPAERALREQSILIQLDEDLPIHAPPRFAAYFMVNLRLQLLFTIVPVLLILAIRDIFSVLFRQLGLSSDSLMSLQSSIIISAAIVVFILAPEILRRILTTQPLPASPLRNRLETLCRQHGLRYRDILLWHTENHTGNAAVMGVIPGVRYILLSDLLLETMTDEQIEAVFAHELGHIVHRHILWYGIFVVILMLAFFVTGTTFDAQLAASHLNQWLPPAAISTGLGVAAFLLTFGYLSRRFERQADVFAARTIQAMETPGEPSHVGQHGAAIFASALHRVAIVNNIPETARSWCHGSIAKRMHYLHDLSRDPAGTLRFDRTMGRIRAVLLAALVVCTLGAWATAHLWPGAEEKRTLNINHPALSSNTPAVLDSVANH